MLSSIPNNPSNPFFAHPLPPVLILRPPLQARQGMNAVIALEFEEDKEAYEMSQAQVSPYVVTFPYRCRHPN
jgi:hypothetical protein